LVTPLPAPPSDTAKARESASSHPPSIPPAPPDTSPVRWGPIAVLGAILIVLNCYWIANSEMKTGVTELTVSVIFMGVLFLLFALVGVNALVRRRLPGIALSQAEMLAVYGMLTLSSAVAGVGAIGFLTPFLGNVTYYADPSNNWARFRRLLPSWFAPADLRVLAPFYEGNESFFRWTYLRAWALPLLAWGLLFFVVLYLSLCFVSIFRAQWTDYERLPFPTAVLPTEMTRTDGGFFNNRLLWIGFWIPFVLQSLNSLHSLYPTIPGWAINHLQDFHEYFAQKPWSGTDAILVGLHPGGLGLTFIAPLDMSFSMWFFYLLKKGLNVFGVARGWRDPDQGWDGDGSGQFPYTAFLAWGAWMVLAFSTYRMAWPHLKEAGRRALRGDPEGKDDGELMSSRAAIAGLLGGFAFFVVFCRLLGSPLWVPAVYFLLYLILMTVLCRVTAEVGPPSISLDWGTPQEMLTGIVGARSFSAPGLLTLTSLSWFNLDYRAAPMPQQLVATKLAGSSRIRLRPLLKLLLFAIAIAIPAAMICDLQMYYANGAATAKVNGWRIETANAPWQQLDFWTRNPQMPNFTAWFAGAMGALIQLAIVELRLQAVGFPLHPAAFSLICTFSMDAFWVDFLLGWLLKALLLRYGGMKAYRAALPFFLGLVLGDFTAGAAWSIAGACLGLDLYRTFPT
jgi:hypothetical protein